MKCWCGGEVDGDPYRCLESKFHDPSATGRPERVECLYVAGPMSGYPECNYPAFNGAAEQLESVGFKVINPATLVAGTERHYVDFLREDLRMMLDCQGVATLEGWWESAGARNEVQVAGLLKMPVRPWSEWVLKKYFAETLARSEDTESATGAGETGKDPNHDRDLHHRDPEHPRLPHREER